MPRCQNPPIGNRNTLSAIFPPVRSLLALVQAQQVFCTPAESMSPLLARTSHIIPVVRTLLESKTPTRREKSLVRANSLHAHSSTSTSSQTRTTRIQGGDRTNSQSES